MPLRIDRCNPATGPSAGTIHVVLEGEGFEAGATVTFGATPAVAVRIDPTELEVTMPALAVGPTNVTVTLLDGTTFTLDPAFTANAPTVVAVAPADGASGEPLEVTITGTDLVDGLGVDFGAAASPNVAWDGPTQVRAVAPGGVVGAVAVRVINPDGVWGEQANAFTFRAPTITGIAPVTGASAGGTIVTITGTDFVGGLEVHFGGTLAPELLRDSDTQVRAVTPDHAVGPVAVRVTNPGGVYAQRNNAFTYHRPTVAAVSPAFGSTAGMAVVKVTGTYFAPGAAVDFGGVASPKVLVESDTTLYAEAPAAAAGAVAVRVTNTDGEHGTLNNAFTYAAPATMGTDDVAFLMDGEPFFLELRTQMRAVAAAPVHAQTYVRLAYWMIKEDVYLGDRTHYGTPAETLVEHIGNVIMAGHHVDVIVWYPNLKDRIKEGDHAEYHEALANALAVKDRLAAQAAAVVPAPNPVPGRVRIYLERYEGVTGSSNHQKIAIFSIAGQRTAIVGGFNLANYYWDSDHHDRYMNDPAESGGWHDTAVRVIGPATDAIEAEWMRRWNRAVAMQASFFTLNDLKNQVRSRYTGLGSRSTIRAAAVAITANNTPQNPPAAPTTTTSIRLTRSTATARHRALRDEIVARIQAAQHYVYMENNQFTDPDIVRALYTAWQNNNALRIRVVTNIGGGGGFGFMTRRSWLQLILRMPHPICERVYYMSESTHGLERYVDRNGAGTWNVLDSYDGSTGATLKPHQRWLLNDGLEIDKLAGGTKTVAFTRITKVVGSFHFYTTLRLLGADVDQPTIHSKLAIFDDEYLVVGTSNWTYRSMQYDGEIATVNRCPPGGAPTLVTTARDRLLSHYDQLSPLWLDNTGDNFAAVAQHNIEGLQGVWAVPDDRYLLVPLCHPDAWSLGNIREAPGRAEMPSYQWI